MLKWLYAFFLQNFFFKDFQAGERGPEPPKSVSEKILQGEKKTGVTDSARADTGRNVPQKSSWICQMNENWMNMMNVRPWIYELQYQIWENEMTLLAIHWNKWIWFAADNIMIWEWYKFDKAQDVYISNIWFLSIKTCNYVLKSIRR